MKAMLLEQIAPIDTAPLKMADLPVPEPNQGEIRIKVRCCAICRTDLHVIEGDLPRQKMPIIPGHQIVGTVGKLGPGCAKFKAGQRVGVTWLRHTCGKCEFCKADKENLCESARFTGYHADGGYAEYALAPRPFATAFPQVFPTSTPHRFCAPALSDTARSSAAICRPVASWASMGSARPPTW